MGLFTNKKRPCPICGNPTPRLFPDGVEGIAICKECSKKADMPDEVRSKLSLDDFRQYIAYYDENQAQRDIFEETFDLKCGGWNDDLSLDTKHGLFRLKVSKESLALEASSLKSFRILEDGVTLFESCPQGLKCCESDAPARAQALEPLIAQFEMQYQQYEFMQEMEKKLQEETDGKSSTSFKYMSRPSFNEQVIQGDFIIELTLDHPYWGGMHSRTFGAPKFSDTSPSVSNFLRSYEKKIKELDALAVNLMSFIDPDAPRINISPAAPAKEAAGNSSAVDPVAEIQRYKALLDSGIITEEEFIAKKRQLLGI